MYNKSLLYIRWKKVLIGNNDYHGMFSLSTTNHMAVRKTFMKFLYSYDFSFKIVSETSWELRKAANFVWGSTNDFWRRTEFRETAKTFSRLGTPELSTRTNTSSSCQATTWDFQVIFNSFYSPVCPIRHSICVFLLIVQCNCRPNCIGSAQF